MTQSETEKESVGWADGYAESRHAPTSEYERLARIRRNNEVLNEKMAHLAGQEIGAKLERDRILSEARAFTRTERDFPYIDIRDLERIVRGK